MNDEIEILYRRFGSMVFRRCRALLGDEESAIDATHDLFAQLVAHRTLEIDTPSSYLYVAATRLCLNRIRDQKTRKSAHASQLIVAIAECQSSEEQSIARNLLARVFSMNPDSTRVIAVLHHVDGMTLEETAKEVGMSVSGVRKRLRSLKETLHTVLEGT